MVELMERVYGRRIPKDGYVEFTQHTEKPTIHDEIRLKGGLAQGDLLSRNAILERWGKQIEAHKGDDAG